MKDPAEQKANSIFTGTEQCVVRECERIVVSELFDTLNNESLGKLHLVIV